MIHEGLIGMGVLISYYMISATLAILLKKILKFPTELNRKMLHIICVMSILVLLNVFDTWYVAVLAAFAFAVIVYIILTLIEHFPLYGKFFSERKAGEVKMSLILVYLMFIILIAIFWGWMGTNWKYIILVAVMAWGYGDAAAALVGKTYGSHYIEHRFVEGKKTFEGTIAMFAVSFLAILITTIMYETAPWHLCFIVALLVAPVCAIVELFSSGGLDTITVPFAASISLFIFVKFLRI